MQGFAVATASSTKFLGEDWKQSTNRNWTNYLLDVNKMIEDCGDLAELQELTVMATQATVVRKVLYTAAGLGMGNQKTYDDYTSQCNLLATHDPPVPNPSSFYCRKAMHGVGANVAHSA